METLTLTSQEQIIAEVKTQLDAGFASFRTDDLDAVMNFYTDDAVLAIGQDVYVGQEQLRPFYAGMFAAYSVTESYAINITPIVVDEEAVTLCVHERMALTPKIPEAPAVDKELMVTFVYRKEHGTWRCCYEQASTFTPVL